MALPVKVKYGVGPVLGPFGSKHQRTTVKTRGQTRRA